MTRQVLLSNKEPVLRKTEKER